MSAGVARTKATARHPELAALLGPAAVRGLQGAGLPVVASVKHYVGDGGTTRGIDQGNTEVDEATLRAVHLAGYGPSIKAGAATIMASYNSWNGAKLHGQKHLLTDVLVGELGFKGFVVSDWKAIEQLPGSFSEQIEASMNAGVDMLMQPDNYERTCLELKKLAENGRIPVVRMDEAVRRILTVKFQMGLFERPFGDPSLMSKVGSPEHRAVARQAVRESQVLLVNRNSTLPLAGTLSNILVAGEVGRRHRHSERGMDHRVAGFGRMRSPSGTTILQGIRAAAPQATVAYSSLGDVPKGAQVAIVVIGELPYAEMKGDRLSLELDPDDVAVVKRVKQSGLPTVVVLVSGRPMILEPILDGRRCHPRGVVAGDRRRRCGRRAVREIQPDRQAGSHVAEVDGPDPHQRRPQGREAQRHAAVRVRVRAELPVGAGASRGEPRHVTARPRAWGSPGGVPTSRRSGSSVADTRARSPPRAAAARWSRPRLRRRPRCLQRPG